MTILLVEPDAITARVVCERFSQEGYQVELARSGQEAIDVLERITVDAIVLEPQLGVHNGVEFLYELRSYADWQHIPVIVWTMNSVLAQRRFSKAWRELGLDYVLYKPDVSLASLARKTSELLAVVK